MVWVVSAIAIITVCGLIAIIILQQRMIMKSQAFFMIADDPRAGLEVLKTIHEKKYEKAEKKKDADIAKKHIRYKDIIQSGVVSDEELKEFSMTGSNA